MAKKTTSKIKPSKRALIKKIRKPQSQMKVISIPRVEMPRNDDKAIMEKKARKTAFKSLIGIVLPSSKVQEFISLYEKHKGPIEDFFRTKEIQQQPDLRAHPDDLKFTMQLSNFLIPLQKITRFRY